MAEPIITKKQVRDEFLDACRTRSEFDAVEYVAEKLQLRAETVAEVVQEEATA